MRDIHIILASGSPRRKELLTQAGCRFSIYPSLADEQTELTSPSEYVTFLAKKKAMWVSENLGHEIIHDSLGNIPDRYIVLGADTVVSLNGRILGKPKDYTDALNTLKSLSGRTHQVFTGVCIIYTDGTSKKLSSFYEKTDVTFYPLTDDEIKEYLETGEPFDKAGSYGIQGKGGLFVKNISGDYNNVVGLPIARVYHEIEKLLC